MYLQLAEGENNGNYQALAESGAIANYIFIPANFLPEFNKDSFVRADYFLKYDDQTAQALISALAPYQQGLSEGVVEGALNFVPGVGPVASKGVALAKKLIENRQQKVASGEKKALFKPESKLGKLFNKLTSKTDQLKKTPVDVQAQVGGTNVGFTYNPPAESGQSFFAKNKTALLIGGGIVAIAGIYLLTKKK